MAAWLVVGLGNPGPTYAFHRHNVGFMVADELARRAGAGFTAPRGMRADICETRLTALGMGGIGADAQRIVLVKPRTFMNDSGAAVAKYAYFGVKPAEVVVVHDELGLDFGRLRLKLGGDSGHNGLKSIRSALGTGDFHRVLRHRPSASTAGAKIRDFVLTNFPASAREELALEDRPQRGHVEAALILRGSKPPRTRSTPDRIFAPSPSRAGRTDPPGAYPERMTLPNELQPAERDQTAESSGWTPVPGSAPMVPAAGSLHDSAPFGTPPRCRTRHHRRPGPASSVAC
ncbi:MAG: aminoacyl-tRNA hydrolase [Micropruina glycogenica]